MAAIADLVNLQRSNVPLCKKTVLCTHTNIQVPPYSLHPTGNQFSNANNNLAQFGERDVNFYATAQWQQQ
nr:CBM_HP1_G0003760.mRNA.1.CDS.1 [Saccharomyces cerevisiae]